MRREECDREEMEFYSDREIWPWHLIGIAGLEMPPWGGQVTGPRIAELQFCKLHPFLDDSALIQDHRSSVEGTVQHHVVLNANFLVDRCCDVF